MKDDDEERWLLLAKEAHETAARLNDSYSKRSLLLIAQRYETLAQRARQAKQDNAGLNGISDEDMLERIRIELVARSLGPA